jgi:hypothetical protein
VSAPFHDLAVSAYFQYSGPGPKKDEHSFKFTGGTAESPFTTAVVPAMIRKNVIFATRKGEKNADARGIKQESPV